MSSAYLAGNRSNVEVSTPSEPLPEIIAEEYHTHRTLEKQRTAEAANYPPGKLPELSDRFDEMQCDAAEVLIGKRVYLSNAIFIGDFPFHSNFEVEEVLPQKNSVNRAALFLLRGIQLNHDLTPCSPRKINVVITAKTYLLFVR